MKIELTGRPCDAASEATVREGLARLAALPVKVLYEMRFDSAATGTWRAWARLEDGREFSVKSSRGSCETPSDELPQFLELLHLAAMALVAAP